MLKSLVQKTVGALGFKLVRKEPNMNEFDKDFASIYQACKPFTMTSVERMYALYKAVEYIVKNKIEGDIVECGVWRGGSSMLVAKTLQFFGDTSRNLYLYDTYEGMSAPTEADKDAMGNSADALMKAEAGDKENSVWCLADLADVQRNMKSTNYPTDKIHFIKGKVEDTIPQQMPSNQLAILRLDTDWYESTRHELVHLFPVLRSAGVLIIDDYGHWQGAKKAVDEYFAQSPSPILLNRIDATGRIAIKTN